MRNVVLVLVGVIISAILGLLGLMLTKFVGDGFFVAIAIISAPTIGFVVFKRVSKQIGLGMMIGSIPLILLGFIVIVASGIH